MIPFHFLMSTILIISTLMVVTSSGWVSMWVALEINTLSFLPLMKSKGASKYFLSQSVGSAFILSGAVLKVDLMIMVGAMIKAGVAPVHSWFPQVMEGLSWKMCAVLSTWQKIGPVFVMVSFFSSKVIYFLVSCSLIMGAIGALKQSQMRSILAYSSITHMGWMLMGVMASSWLGLTYFFIYCLTTIFLMIKLSEHDTKMNSLKDLTFIFLLFSMSGLPPLIGFFPKMWVFLNSSIVMTSLLIMSSVIMILVYTSIMMASTGKKMTLKSGPAVFFVFLSGCGFM